MSQSPEAEMSRRERQAMDAVVRLGEATAREVMAELPDAPGYSAVRSLLSLLVEKDWLKAKKKGRTLVYRSARPASGMRRGALRRVLETFFDDSPERLVEGLLESERRRLTPDELTRIRKMIEDKEKEALT